MRRRALGLALVLATALAGCATGWDQYRPQSPVTDPAGPVDVGHLDSKFPDMSNPEVDAQSYDLVLDWDGTTLTGRTTVVVRVAQDTSTLRLNLYEALDVTAATLDGADVSWTGDDISVTFATGPLQADSEHTLVIDYAGSPAAAPIEADRFDMSTGMGWIENPQTGQVSTFAEPFGSLTYFPVNEAVWDEAYYTATITAPPGLVAVFNGPLLNREEANGRTTTTWGVDEPISPYLVVLAIGAYHTETRTMSDGTPYTIWWPAEFDHMVDEMWAASARTWDWLLERLGPYPFATAGFVVTGDQSAMETQTMISMGAEVMYWGFEETLLHELAHQWFGNAVTPADWTHLWLSEGWAMYLQADYAGNNVPEAFGDWCDSDVLQSGQAGDYKPTAFANNNVYVCPVPILAQIRTDVGDDAFWAMAAAWAADNMNRNVTREDFRAFLEQQTGTDYGPLFATWLDEAGPS